MGRAPRRRSSTPGGGASAAGSSGFRTRVSWRGTGMETPTADGRSRAASTICAYDGRTARSRAAWSCSADERESMTSLERLATQTPTEAAAAPFRGRRYNEDRLHLLIRDPHRAAAIWEISLELHARAESMAKAARAPLRYRILVHQAPSSDRTPSTTIAIDLPDALRDETWFLDLRVSGGVARAELGLDLPSGFTGLLASRWMPVPPDGPCAETGDWSIDPAMAAWLDAEAARARSGSPRTSPSSVARYLV